MVNSYLLLKLFKAPTFRAQKEMYSQISFTVSGTIEEKSGGKRKPRKKEGWEQQTFGEKKGNDGGVVSPT